MHNNVPFGVLDRMSPDEVTAMIVGLRDEAGRLEAWNAKRGNWSEPAPRWQVCPPPRSQEDYGKIRVKDNYR